MARRFHRPKEKPILHRDTGKPGTETLSHSEPPSLGRSIRIDLAAAREAWLEEADNDPEERRRRKKDRDFLAYEDSDGRFPDFHALRVSFGTALARAGVRLQMAQRLMRHSTPVLTANAYTRLELHDLRGAVARLSGDNEEPTRLRA